MPDPTLKPGWTRVRFGDVVRLNTDRVADPLAAGIERYVGLEHIDPDDLRIRRWGLVADGTTFTNRFRPGQVLFGKRRAYQRKVAVADFEGVCSGDIYVFEPCNDWLLPELLPFLCQTDAFLEHAIGTSAGSLSPRTNWGQLAEYELALPPVAEQRRMVEVLQLVCTSREGLRTAADRLRDLRHAAESYLFSPDGSRDNLSIGDLMARRSVSLQTGPFGTVLRASSYVEFGHPVINPVDIRDGAVTTDNCKRVADADWMRLEKYQLHTGDLLIGRKRDMSIIANITTDSDGCLMGSDCIRFRIHDDTVMSKYLYYYLRAETTRRWLQYQAYGTVMPGINEGLLMRLRIHLGDATSQAAAVNMIEILEASVALIHRRLSALAKLQGSITVSMALGASDHMGEP